MSDDRLAWSRSRLDLIDEALSSLLAERAEVIAEVAERKRLFGLPAVDPVRRAEVLARFPEGLARDMAEGIVSASERFQRAIIEASDDYSPPFSRRKS